MKNTHSYSTISSKRSEQRFAANYPGRQQASVRTELLVIGTGMLAAAAIFFFLMRPFSDFSFYPFSSSTSHRTMPEDGVPYLFQYDPDWKDLRYGDGSMEQTGCGPTSLAMAMQALTGQEISPVSIAQYSRDNGYYVEGAGTSWDLFTDYPSQYGLASYQAIADETLLLDELESGKLLILSMNPGDFTSSGHILLAAKAEESGMINIHDPNSESRSHPWKIGDVLSQAAAIWVIG